jgi:hypothetical protein
MNKLNSQVNARKLEQQTFKIWMGQVIHEHPSVLYPVHEYLILEAVTQSLQNHS